jgi:N-acetylmuramoyl-L-alanine amidase
MGFKAIVLRIKVKYIIYMLALAFVIVNGYDWVHFRLNQQAVETMSWALAGKIIVIDPGHGGYDPGKVGVSGVLEKDINLAIAKKLAQIVRGSGATVVLTREQDVDLVTEGEGTKKKRDLDNRLKIVEDVGADLYVGIQANALGTRWTGAQTFYMENNVDGRNLALSIQGEIRRQLKNTDRKALRLKEETSYILRNLNHLPAVLVEVGFLSNKEEEKLLNDPVYQEKMAMAIYSGIVKYFGDLE